MLTKRLTIPTLACCAALLSAYPSAGARQDSGYASLSPVIPPQIILAPTEVRTDPTLARGCWVRLFPETGFKGEARAVDRFAENHL